LANEHQFKLRTRYVATRGVQEYRATIPTIVRPEDIVLELGCAWGTTTAILARHGREVVGTDVSPQCIARARTDYPDVRFEVLDAFDVRAALRLGRPFTKVYADLSGLSSYRALLDVIALLTMYATVLRPDAIVVKSGALKQFAAFCSAWPAAEAGRRVRPGTGQPASDQAEEAVPAVTGGNR
jgi:trans-aconitate methyltransferase